MAKHRTSEDKALIAAKERARDAAIEAVVAHSLPGARGVRAMLGGLAEAMLVVARRSGVTPDDLHNLLGSMVHTYTCVCARCEELRAFADRTTAKGGQA